MLILRCAVAAALLIIAVVNYDKLTKIDMRALVAGAGSTAAAVAVIIGVFAVKSVLFIIPASMIYISVGMAFPTPSAIAINLAGIALEITATYLLFPVYWRFFSRSRSKPRFTALFAAVWYLCSIPLAGVLKPIVFLFINRVPSFVLGVLLGWQQQNGGLKLSRRAVNTAAAVSAAAGLILGALCTFGETAFFQPPYNSTFPGVLIAFGFTVLLAELGGLLDRGGRAARGVNGFFGFFGRISLEIYCVQEFLGPIAADAARALGCGSLAVNLIQLAAVTLSAWLLHILADRVLALTGRLHSRAKCAG